MLLVAALLTIGATAAPEDVRLIAIDGEGAKYWPRWRGPSGQGYVAGTNYTDTWSDKERVQWRTPVPGVGHSSPVIWKDHLFLTTATADGSRMSMLAFSRATGKPLWETALPTKGVEHVYWKNSRASATPTTDGERVYASFGTHGLAAFDFTGKIVWHTRLGDLRNYHGSAGSPVLYKDRLFLYQDHDGTATLGSFVAAFDAKSGKVLWKRDRLASVGWGTPIVIHTGERDELIVSSQGTINSYNPDTGEELWHVRGNSREVIPTPVVGHGLVFCSSGRIGPTFAIRPGGKGDVTATHVAWSHPARIAVRALWSGARRPAVSRERHAEHPDGLRSEDRQARCIRTVSVNRFAKASRPRPSPSATRSSSRTISARRSSSKPVRRSNFCT